VADLVEGVTKLTRVQYTSKEDEQMENMRKMLLAMTKDIRVILIKIADRLHNMRTMAYQSRKSSGQVPGDHGDLRAPGPPPGHAEGQVGAGGPGAAVPGPRGYKEITDVLDAKMPVLEDFMAKVQKQITEARLKEENINASVYSRIKHIYSIYRKMYAQKLDINGIFDLCAFRVIVDTIPTATTCWAYPRHV
jgi:GTP pyrophosphokinase